MRPDTTCKAGLIQGKLILDSKAFGLTTEARPPTVGPTVYVSLVFDKTDGIII